ncbi:MAG: FtsW/RodA/SpoVE family cell cycle protein [Saprospiraceae bacterium]|jgi:cell division protein FtsW|uniref:FtsW/RodA/SpoVE family cell cycle protein n=2 Tax=Candidatus Brachybacter algidus TaxID=2982024 RepID=UPI001B636442|nr:FtsW/RodA/SpoVE family cell cycle protein [Candidatus Brachybacter algidus]MBP7304751.1 FtsW/RodA/SpoVE family cell cycle protein [Saprospiraceae bacterium]MBK6374287.1 FtsW/RodA/SpoVE family cell cycle protein [Candidatus Brachybacter algidus]MBK8841468.1 FtsW/RodA/SpoVE family cell cycle protein [Candidatus Brachybacter algidus]MBK9554022.1 FtsW/RodA/SpoVE family cell cycle protein [Candidatus Brachybacter algidus]MBP8890983.1 FtsW/RodA/SpoVE family cell cycle protein [Saprospiraceae bact
MKMKEWFSTNFKGDPILWIVLVLLALGSLLAVYSTTGGYSQIGNSHGANNEYFLFKQLAFLIVGVVLAYLCHLAKYSKYSAIALPFLFISIMLLVLVLFFGIEVNGAKRWLPLPFVGLTIQPADIAKLALMVYLARTISGSQTKIKNDISVFWSLLIPTLLVCILILPNNLSTAALLFATSIIVMFVGRIPLKYIGSIFAIGTTMFLIVFIIGYYLPTATRAHTWSERISTFMGDEESFQSKQAHIAIANGGIIGTGPGNSMQRNFLPYAHADFIYAIICEEFGLLGAAGVMGIYLLMLYRCIRLVKKSPKTFGAMLAIGLCINIVIQAYANIMVNVGLIPDTGVTLPIISLGGTSLIFTCISFGIILSVSRYIESRDEAASAVQVNNELQTA